MHHAEESALPVVGGVRGIAMLCGMGVNSAERATAPTTQRPETAQAQARPRVQVRSLRKPSDQ